MIRRPQDRSTHRPSRSAIKAIAESGGAFVTGRGHSSRFAGDVVVIGGCGRAGLPLAVALADRGARVAIYDVSVAAVEAVNGGPPPVRPHPAAVPLRPAPPPPPPG